MGQAVSIQAKSQIDLKRLQIVLKKERDNRLQITIIQKPDKADKPDKDVFTILLLGQPGLGKSLIANILIDGHNSQKFKSEDSGDLGVTQVVQSAKGHLFGIPSNRPIRVVDTPGLMDRRVDMRQMLQDIKDAVGENTVDAVVIPLMANQRFTEHLQTAYSLANTFLAGLTPANIFPLVTYCDKFSPLGPLWIDQIIKSFKDSNQTVVKENFIQYNHNSQQESLFRFAILPKSNCRVSNQPLEIIIPNFQRVNLAAIGQNLSKNPESTLGSEFVKYLAYATKGLAIIGLFTATAIAVVLAAGAVSTSVALAGGLGAIIAVCANNPAIRLIVTDLLAKVAGLTEDEVRAILDLIARLAAR